MKWPEPPEKEDIFFIIICTLITLSIVIMLDEHVMPLPEIIVNIIKIAIVIISSFIWLCSGD